MLFKQRTEELNMKLNALAQSFIGFSFIAALTACSSSGFERTNLNQANQRYHAILLQQEPVTLNSSIPEGAVTGASFGLFTEIDGDSEDMISGMLAGALVGSVISAVTDGSNQATRYRFYNQKKGEFSVVSKQKFDKNVQCVEVHHTNKIKLYAVDSEFCRLTREDNSVKAIYGGKLQRIGTNAWHPATVIVKDELIIAVNPTSQEIPAGAQLIDGRGTWLIPGLVDGHVHLSQSGSAFTRPDMIGATHIHSYGDDQSWLIDQLPSLLEDYVSLGITTIADLGGPTKSLHVRNQLNCESHCPSIISAGELISATPVPALNGAQGPTFLNTETSAEAIAAVKMQRQFGAKISKFVFTSEAGLSPSQLDKLFSPAINEAKSLGQIIAVHAQDLDYAKAAIRAGADILVHGVMTAPVDDEFIELAKTLNVTYMPTLTAYEHYLDIFKRQLTFSEFERQFGDHYIIDSFAQLNENLSATDQMFQLFTRYVPFVDSSEKERSSLTPQEQSIVAQLETLFSERILQIQVANLFTVANAGVRLGFGTDAGNPATLHAYSVAEEINAWQHAGLDNLKILHALTEGNAIAYQIEKKQGSIAPGKSATFNLLTQDPLQNTNTLLAPALVIANGNIIDLQENK
ncbi:hypothetical protein CWI82_01050 [Pseudidiomarina tainanensis]|uniref:Uncharacterized protein n=1 Tax=Pseudidiomarina tainanensis TaxID=502365 RepID=A0ACD2HH31_9GAMM|nr:hypothetical protein CWI82_01050 [Pseudidiomarina tainanensis]